MIPKREAFSAWRAALIAALGRGESNPEAFALAVSANRMLQVAPNFSAQMVDRRDSSAENWAARELIDKHITDMRKALRVSLNFSKKC